MRAIFGIVSLLVVVLIVAWLFSTYTATVTTTGQQAQQQAAQLAGQDLETGARASESADIDLVTAGGKPDSILVTSVASGGAYERYWGLRSDDTILTVGPLNVKGHPSITSTDDAAAFLMDAYQRKQQLVVVRDGEQITLPQVGQAQQQQPPPAGRGTGSGDPIQQQLEGIGVRRGL
jgi:hypothetical protein